MSRYCINLLGALSPGKVEIIKYVSLRDLLIMCLDTFLTNIMSSIFLTVMIKKREWVKCSCMLRYFKILHFKVKFKMIQFFNLF